MAPDSVTTAPRFSIVSAVYNVSRYLPDFIASVEAQTFPLDDVEVILVDDGSTDDSLTLVREWEQRRPGTVRVVTKTNGGQATARNTGLELATGEWVTFTDPDDKLDPAYLSEVDAFLRANPTTELVACQRTLLFDSTGELQRHPLWQHFQGGNRLRDLDEHPTHFYGSAPCAFFRTAVVREQNLRFDPEIRPNFEDGHFLSVYLFSRPRPLVGFVGSANYIYRKRDDNSSTMQTSMMNPGRFTTVLRLGYLDLLERSVALRGDVPGWLQSLVLYDLSWYFSAEDRVAEAQTTARGAVAEEFHELLGRIVTYLDPDLIESFTLRPYRAVWRDLLLHGYDPQAWHSPYVVLDRVDRQQRLTRVSYRFTGERPSEEFVVSGERVTPVHQKVRALPYFDRTLLHERLVWLPAGTTQVLLGGRRVELRTEDRPLTVRVMGERTIERFVAPLWLKPRGEKFVVSVKIIRLLSRLKPVRRLFGNAWVLTDRVHDADDSAEHLFRYLRAERPKVNAWFVIEKGTPDHARLVKDGYRRRVVPHGGLLWKLLMLNCRHLVSSHADAAITRPAGLRDLIPRPQWRFTFLQHGVIKDDLSLWLNDKNIDIFVTSTPGEYDSICADGTTYRYTTKETKLTGLPRFDRVLAAGRACPPAERDLLLVAPTWRNWLAPPTSHSSQRREVAVDRFLRSEFAQSWIELLTSPELRRYAEQHHLTVATLMHPNLQAVVPSMGLPAHVRTFTFEGNDVRELFARARVLVTDYSSMAFNAAYIDRAVVYYQFDRDRMLDGGHVGRRGYFDYERDGFGPVALTAVEALKAVEDVLDNGPDPLPEYRARIEQTFPMRDGRCSERVADAIAASTRRVRVAELAATPDSGDDVPTIDEPVSDAALDDVRDDGDSDRIEVRAHAAPRQQPGGAVAGEGRATRP